MRRRFFGFLIGGSLGLVMMSPVFATGDSPVPMASPSPSSSPPSSTPPSSSPPTSDKPPSSSDQPPSSANCTPVITQEAAPAEGETSSYEAGEAGSVDVRRSSSTDLLVAGTSPEQGWTVASTTPSGPRVKVRFTNDADPHSLVRLAASLDRTGSQINLRVETCK